MSWRPEFQTRLPPTLRPGFRLHWLHINPVETRRLWRWLETHNLERRIWLFILKNRYLYLKPGRRMYEWADKCPDAEMHKGLGTWSKAHARAHRHTCTHERSATAGLESCLLHLHSQDRGNRASIYTQSQFWDRETGGWIHGDPSQSRSNGKTVSSVWWRVITASLSHGCSQEDFTSGFPSEIPRSRGSFTLQE